MNVPPHAVLHDEAAIAARVRDLAAAIRADLPGDALLLVGVLTGSFVFVADLARELARAGVHARIEMVWAACSWQRRDARRAIRITRIDDPVRWALTRT